MKPTKKSIYVLITLSGKHTNVEIHAGNSLETLIECRSSLEYRVSTSLRFPEMLCPVVRHAYDESLVALK